MGAIRDAIDRVWLTIAAALSSRTNDRYQDAGPDYLDDLLTDDEPYPRRSDGGRR